MLFLYKQQEDFFESYSQDLEAFLNDELQDLEKKAEAKKQKAAEKAKAEEEKENKKEDANNNNNSDSKEKDKEVVVEAENKKSGVGSLIFGVIAIGLTLGAVNIFKNR